MNSYIHIYIKHNVHDIALIFVAIGNIKRSFKPKIKKIKPKISYTLYICIEIYVGAEQKSP